MDRILASFIFGSLLSLFLPLVPVFFCVSILLILLLLFFCPQFKTLLYAWLLGFCLMMLHGFSYQQQKLNIKPQTFAQAIKLKVEVLNLIALLQNDVSNNTKLQLQILPSIISEQLALVDAHVRVSVNATSNQAITQFKQGDQLECWLKLKPAYGLANVGSFNYQQWLMAKQIVATGYLLTSKPCVVVTQNISKRQQSYDHFATQIEHRAFADVLLALTFGDKQAMTRPHLLFFQQTGLQHLVAISGLHLSLVFIASFKIAEWLITLMLRLGLFFKSTGRIFRKANWRYWQYGVSFITVIGYAYLAGFSQPTVRALVMLAWWLLAKCFHWHWSVLRWLLVSFASLLLLEPLGVLSISFWLSFIAVAIIFATLWPQKGQLDRFKKWQKLASLLRLQLMLTFGLLPIIALNFNQISVFSVVTNVIAVPLFSFAIIPLALAALIFSQFWLFAGDLLAGLADTLLQYFYHAVQFLLNDVDSLYQVSQSYLILVILLLMFSVILLLFFRQNNRITTLLIGLCVGLAGLGMKATTDSTGWQLYALDVGQGSAILLVQNQHAVLYDTAASFPSGFSVAQASILPLLRALNINQIDHLFISHNDNDHAGGLNALAMQQTINTLWFNQPIAKKLVNQQNTCVAGTKFSWQQLTFSILSPQQAKADLNQDSCVILVSDGHHHVLLTGDIDQTTEFLLTKRYPTLTADILLAPHHGSKTSSSTLFLQHLTPKYGVFSTGFYNQWQMPNQQVVNRYQQLSIQQFNTAEHGMVVFDINQQQILARTMRNDLWPYWFAN